MYGNIEFPQYVGEYQYLTVNLNLSSSTVNRIGDSDMKTVFNVWV